MIRYLVLQLVVEWPYDEKKFRREDAISDLLRTHFLRTTRRVVYHGCPKGQKPRVYASSYTLARMLSKCHSNILPSSTVPRGTPSVPYKTNLILDVTYFSTMNLDRDRFSVQIHSNRMCHI